MPNLKHIHTFGELKAVFPNAIRVCSLVGFEYFNLDGEHFCKVAYYYYDTDVTYDSRDGREDRVDCRKFEVILVYTDDQELE